VEAATFVVLDMFTVLTDRRRIFFQPRCACKALLFDFFKTIPVRTSVANSGRNVRMNLSECHDVNV